MGAFFVGIEYGRPLPLESKQLADDAWEVSGYLSTFGNLDNGGDIVLPGAFDASLASGRKVKFLFGHNDEKVLGPPLQLRVDDHGLFATGRISRTQLGADIHTLLLDGAIDAWSIGYLPTDVGFKESDDERGLIRLLKAVDLFEGSLVAVPMNEAAVVTGVKQQRPGDGLDYEQHAAALLDGVEEFLGRTRHGAERRAKEGRAISTARRQRMAGVSGSLRQAADEIDAMLEETSPPEKAAAYSPRLALSLTAARLRRHGVAVEG